MHTPGNRHIWLVVVLLLGLYALSGQAAPKVQTGDQAPDWILTAIEGKDISFYEDSAGQPAVLVFWATWCRGCPELMNAIDQLRETYSEEDLRVYALNIWEDGDPMEYLRSRSYDFPVFLNGDLVAKRYGVRGAPAVFLVDGDKTLRYVRRKDSTAQEVHRAVKAALQQMTE